MQRAVAAIVAVALASVLLVAGAVGPAFAQEATSTTEQEGTATPTDERTAAEEQPTTDDGTAPDDGTATPPIDQHDDPDNTSEEGDLGSLSDWLGGHLAGRLEGGMVELSEGQYESVEGLVGDEYESRLAQFVDVAGETNAEWDDRAASTYREIGDDQRQFAEDVQSYRETLAAFRDARQRGDEAAAREHARELADLAEDIRDNGGELERGYRAIENATDAELDEGNAALDEVLTNVTTTQANVVETTFVETTLSVTTNRSVAAFDRPARIEGSLRTENLTAVADRRVRIRVGSRTTTVTTDGAGEFAVVYRPVTIAADAESVPVAYRPRGDSPYFGTNDSVSLGIEPVEPTVALSVTPDVAAFGDRLAVDASVTVDGRPVPGLATRTTIGGITLGGESTDDAGDAGVSGGLPATVAAGERSVRVVAGDRGQAVGRAVGTESVTVTETATALSVDAGASGDTITVDGTLATAEDRPIANQSITVEAGASTTTLSTNATGGFAGRLDADAAGQPGEQIDVVASFDGSGTNLEAARETASVTLASNAGSDGENPSRIPFTILVAMLGLVMLAGAWIAWRFLSAREAGPAPDADRPPASAPTTSSASEASRWLERSRAALDRGDDHGAVARAYAASYARVTALLDREDEPTPRELLAAAEDTLDSAQVRALTNVTAAYERLAFAGERATDARAVVADADEIVDPSDRSPTADD